jgi:hypothetical protein
MWLSVANALGPIGLAFSQFREIIRYNSKLYRIQFFFGYKVWMV